MKKTGKKSIISKLGLFDRYNLAFFLSSVIPLAVLVFVSHRYVLPSLEANGQNNLGLWIRVLLYMLVFLAILAFFVSRAATGETVEAFRSNNEKLKNIFVIAESLSRESYLDVLLDSIVKRAIELTGASAGIAMLRNDEKGMLEFQITRGTGAISEKTVSADTGVAGWVVKNQKVARINDVSADKRYRPEQNILPDFETGSILAVPLSSSGYVFGVLELLKTKNNPGFSDEDENLLKSLAGQTTIFIQNVRYRELQQNYFTHITELLLTALEGTRQIWPGHLSNTARYAYLLARQLGLTDAELKTVHYASLLHDIGFVKINLQEGPPRKLIELHPEIGYDMIKPITLWKDVAPLIRYHHERFDGKGYPGKLTGENIPLGARILAVAETLDVICNPKSYRKETLDLQNAYQEIRAYAGSQFDPTVVDALEKVIESGQM
jgi:HD-GYP domain-containing protein (c-di-GMP phosphodiesterase class II)